MVTGTALLFVSSLLLVLSTVVRGGTVLQAAKAEPELLSTNFSTTTTTMHHNDAAESIAIIYDSKTDNSSASSAVGGGEPIETVVQAVQHQTEKIYEGIVKLFAQLVGGGGGGLEQHETMLPLERTRSTASRHAATCFNAIDIVGPNHDALRDAIVDFHNGLRVERCMSPFNLATAERQHQSMQDSAATSQMPTLLHWDDVLVKVADKILDIGAARACEAHHSSSDINALAAKKFSHFGVNTWQSHKTCNWADVLNEWSAPAVNNVVANLFGSELSLLAPSKQPSESTPVDNSNKKSRNNNSQHNTMTESAGQQHAADDQPKTNAGRFYRQMLWKGATGIGCAATLVACGELHHTVKLYACVYNNRVPEHARDTDDVMCGEMPTLTHNNQHNKSVSLHTGPTFEKPSGLPGNDTAATQNTGEFGASPTAANQESGTLPDKTGSEFGVVIDTSSVGNQFGMLLLNK